MKPRCLFQIGVVMLLLFPISVSAIEWEKTYSYGDWWSNPTAVQQTEDKGYIIAATTTTLDWDYFIRVLKLDKEGSVAWQKTYGGIVGVWVSFIQQTPDKGYVVAGDNRLTSAPLEIWVLKLDSSGNVIWQKRYGLTDLSASAFPTSFQQTTDGGYIVAGAEVVFKLDSDGNVVWQKTYEEIGRIAFIQQTKDDGYIMMGIYATSCYLNPFCIYYVWVVKLDSSGNVLWERRYEENRFPGDPTSFQKTADGGYIMMGNSDEATGLWVLKLDSKGRVVWLKTYTYREVYPIMACSIQQTKDGGYITAGYIYASPDTMSIWVLKLGKGGRVIWSKTYAGMNQYATVESIQQTADGGYIMAGETLVSTDTSAIWVLKLDSSGSIPGCDIISENKPLVSKSRIFGIMVNLPVTGEASLGLIPANVTPEDSEAIISSVCGGSSQY